MNQKEIRRKVSREIGMRQRVQSMSPLPHATVKSGRLEAPTGLSPGEQFPHVVLVNYSHNVNTQFLILQSVGFKNLCFFPCFFFFNFYFYFTILCWFCHTLTWIHHGCTCVPKHEPPSHLLPHIISLGHHCAPAPSMLYPASDIDWRFDSYMIVYMFQCHSPKSSHALPLPLSPKVRYTHLCLFCCLAYSVIIAIFLYSIYLC